MHQIPMSFRELVADKSLIWLKAILRNEFAIPSQTFTKVVGGCACIGQSELLTSFCRMMLRWWNGSGKIQTWSPRAKTFGCELQMPRSPIIHGSLTCTGMLWVFRVQGSCSCTMLHMYQGTAACPDFGKCWELNRTSCFGSTLQWSSLCCLRQSMQRLGMQNRLPSVGNRLFVQEKAALNDMSFFGPESSF